MFYQTSIAIFTTFFNVNFYNKFIKFWISLFFQLFFILSELFPYLLPYIYHHHHDVRLARISLILSLHVSLSFIASGRSSRLHPVSSHSCCMYVRAGRPAFDWPYAGVHRSTSLTISSLLLPAVSGMSGSSSLYSFRDRW